MLVSCGSSSKDDTPTPTGIRLKSISIYDIVTSPRVGTVGERRIFNFNFNTNSNGKIISATATNSTSDERGTLTNPPFSTTTVLYEYDEQGRLKKTDQTTIPSSFAPSNVLGFKFINTYSYNSQGKLETYTDNTSSDTHRSNEKTTYQYNSDKKVIKKISISSNLDEINNRSYSDSTADFTYHYDTAGNRTRATGLISRTSIHDSSKFESTSDYIVTYSYDSNNRLSSILRKKGTDGTIDSQYTYDNEERVNRITASGDNEIINFTYTNNSITSTTTRNGTETGQSKYNYETGSCTNILTRSEESIVFSAQVCSVGINLPPYNND